MAGSAHASSPEHTVERINRLIPPLDLVRRFAVDWLAAADPSVPAQIMSIDYRVHIGPRDIVGRHAYIDAVTGVLNQFPGLGFTVHEVLTDGTFACLVFTEHGASTRHGFRAAAWKGVTVFRIHAGLLYECWAQEDYFGRRRQLSNGAPDPIPSPAVAPWTSPIVSRDRRSETVAIAWLKRPTFELVELDDGREGELRVDPSAVEVAVMFSGGGRVAFAGTWTGPLLGGVNVTTSLDAVGLLTVDRDRVVAGTVITDRATTERRHPRNKGSDR